MFCYFKACLHFTVFSLAEPAFTTLTISGCQKQNQVVSPDIITIAYTTNLNTVLVHIVFVNGELLKCHQT